MSSGEDGNVFAEHGRFHRNRRNLAIHLIAVPVFVVSTVAMLFHFAEGRFAMAAAFALGPAVSLALQGGGHRREEIPPKQSRGRGNFFKRILVEQFFTFPLFVLSGSFFRQWRNVR
jgi:hypothetical protein